MRQLLSIRAYDICVHPMSFALAYQNNKNKAGDSKSSTSAMRYSTHHHLNLLNRDSCDYIFSPTANYWQSGCSKAYESQPGFDFGKIAIQPKLKISQPGDEYEQEADIVAERVVRMADTANAVVSIANAKDEGIARKCGACKMAKDEEEKLTISRKPSNISNLEANDDIADEINNVRSSIGSSLDADTKEFMESQFGYDFSKVRIHSDERAARSAIPLNALAYTVGNDIVFAEGQYQPSTMEGRRLLAHELTHIVQQTSTFAGPLVLYRQNRSSGCTADKISLIEEARRAAAIRCQLAAFQTKGLVPPGPMGRPDGGEAARRRARNIARTIFGEDLNMEQVGDIVSNMGARLASPSLPFACAPANDPNCGSRAGYVIGFRPPVYLCPAFFNAPADKEQRIRTMVHEAAHLAGIGEAVGESYCPIFDCQTSCGGFDVADSWSHYIHCVSNQTPDQPEVIRSKP
jgi:hypothetical protein